ncbi:MAG: NAD(P)H-binding protein [Pseudomonadota bacterium]
MTVVVAGATGTIGRAVVKELLKQGHEVLCILRPGTDHSHLIQGAKALEATFDQLELPHSATAIISCIASRTGEPKDAWAVDYAANKALLAAAQTAGIAQFTLLSAICVQKPKRAFQQAKLAFEAELQSSGLPWSIVRPTAFFKSLSGQVERVKNGKPYLVFGDGNLTACKPISDRDLARYIVSTLGNPELTGRVLPIGGPGPAITPRDQAMKLFELLDRPPKIRKVSPKLLSVIGSALSLVSKIFPSLKAKAELAKIGHYYATESMLVWDPQTQSYSADATPEFGQDHYFDHLQALVVGEAQTELGAHQMFGAAGSSRTRES